MGPDDPLDRLQAEEDWTRRARAVERGLARESRRVRRRRRWRTVGGTRGAEPPPRRAARDRSRRGISWIFLALVAIMLATAWALWAGAAPATPTAFVFVVAGWLVTLCLHEFAHALVAHHGGDDTVAAKGYLRLDPRRYGHPILTVVLPLLFLVIGGIPLPGGAVWIERHRLRSRLRDALVSAAGPAVNIAAAAVLLAVISSAGPEAIYQLDEPHAPFWAALTFLAYLQVAVAILNLIPIPGLDGYGIIEPYLPERHRRTGHRIRPFGLLLVLALILLPPFHAAFSAVIELVVDLAGSPVNGYYYGYHLVRFWDG